jgi:hypothetical protein
MRVSLHSEPQALKISRAIATFEVGGKVCKLGSVSELGWIMAEEEGISDIKCTGVRHTLQ